MTHVRFEPNAYDLLMWWCSHRGSIPVAKWTHACESLGTRFNLGRVRNWDLAMVRKRYRWRLTSPLESLGHVEYEPVRRRYCIVPPTIVWTVQHDDCVEGVFYGARSPQWGDDLTAKFGRAFKREAQGDGRDGPERWAVVGKRSDLERQLAELDIRVATTEERGMHLLSALPSVSHSLTNNERYEASSLTTRWQMAAFHRKHHRIEWTDRPSEPSSPGLYREADGTHAWFCITPAGNPLRLQTPEEMRLACWWEVAKVTNDLKNQSVNLVYNSARDILFVPRIRGTSLPMLVDRSLRMASGWSPTCSARGTMWEYVRVGDHRARQAARVLELALEIR